MAPVLERLGLLTEADGPAFACYCMAYSRWVQAEKAIAEHNAERAPDSEVPPSCFVTPKGYIQQIPAVGIANQAIKEIRAWCAEFGMTPSARSRMSVTGDDSDDDMEDLLSGR
jgi:P27 family predicted phage terminase small subunit